MEYIRLSWVSVNGRRPVHFLVRTRRLLSAQRSRVVNFQVVVRKSLVERMVLSMWSMIEKFLDVKVFG